MANRNEMYDNLAKVILSEPSILAHILKEYVLELQNYSIEEIISLFDYNVKEIGHIFEGNTENIILGKGVIRYDKLFDIRLNNGKPERILVNIEAQRNIRDDKKSSNIYM